MANGNWCNGVIVNSQNVTTGPTAINCTPTVSPYGKYVIDVSKHDFAPRVGLAWDPFGKGTTSIRTGYGIYHEQVLNGTFEQNIGQNPPYQITAINPAATRLDVPVTGTSASATVQTLRAVQTDWKTPYMQHWSLDIQHQFGKNTHRNCRVFWFQGYSPHRTYGAQRHKTGSCFEFSVCTGHGLLRSDARPDLSAMSDSGYVFRNNATQTGNPNGADTDILILDQLRPFKGFRSIAIVQPRYTSSYHSLQVSAQHRFSGASQINMAYTLSKNLTDNQTDRSTAPQDTYNIPGEKSRATLDRLHVFNVNYVYELPFYKNAS